MAADETQGQGGERGTRRWTWVGLALIVALAAGLRLWRLDRNGTGNPYYAAAVRSMLKGPSNFAFVAFDPAGFLAVDKPPVALWIQAASAGLFGYGGLSLLVPQALMGVGSVVLVYHLTARAFGAAAGWLAGLFLAITPVGVAVDRSNLPDTALVFVLLLAAWALMAAVDTGRTWPLLLSAALVGVGYNIKMLAAFLVLPAFIAVAALVLPIGIGRRLGGLAASAVVLAAVSLSWSLLVELTPASSRPYLGGSRTNSALDLAFGYNGLERIFWKSGKTATSPAPSAGFDGTPGPLRFAGPVMAGQITWLFPLALVGAAAIAAWRPWSRPAVAAWILWVGWLVTHWFVFSFARGVLHEYYTVALGPPIAALAGAGAIALRVLWRQGGWRAGLLPLALVMTLAWQAAVLGHFPEWRHWLLPGMIAPAGLAAALIAARIGTWCSAAREGAAYALAVLSLLVAPAVWSLLPILAQGDSMIPVADPSALAGPPGGMPWPGRPPFELDERGAAKLADFLAANRHGEPIAMAAMESFLAAPLIIEKDLPAISLGGFAGEDRIVDVGQLTRMVQQGRLRFVLIVPGQGRANAALLDGIRQYGRPIDPRLWRLDEPKAVAQVPATAMRARAREATMLYDLNPNPAPIVPAAAR